jgi:DNA-binding FadR family transcriptional regulator
VVSMLTLSNEFLEYLVSHRIREEVPDLDGSELCRLPSLSELSKELGLSVSLLREQLEVAKAIGLVEVRPRTGIRSLPYSFLPAVRQSLSFAIKIDWSYFSTFSDLRNHIESAYWYDAVPRLNPADRDMLRNLIAQAWVKLRGQPIQIPHQEHRQLHMGIYGKLDNPFVTGLLEAYWEAYEAVGLNLFADYDYLQQVWQFHEQMVDAICEGNYEIGYQALVNHRDLLFHRPFHLSENGLKPEAKKINDPLFES